MDDIFYRAPVCEYNHKLFPLFNFCGLICKHFEKLNNFFSISVFNYIRNDIYHIFEFDNFKITLHGQYNSITLDFFDYFYNIDLILNEIYNNDFSISKNYKKCISCNKLSFIDEYFLCKTCSKNLTHKKTFIGNEGYIYIASESNGIIKIGFSKHFPTQRIRKLRQDTPFNLRLRGVYFSKNTRSDEKKIKEHLKNHQIRGEWFKYDYTKLLASNVLNFKECDIYF